MSSLFAGMTRTASIATAVVPLGNLNQPARYLDWGPVQISVGNLLMIAIGLVLFVLAIFLPFPKGRRRP
jgi:hypothetical protein